MAKLTPEARRFKKWLTTHYDVTGCEPLVTELVASFDDLLRLRAMAAEARATGDAVLTIRLHSAITKANSNFVRVWKAAGLSQIELPAEIRNQANRR